MHAYKNDTQVYYCHGCQLPYQRPKPNFLFRFKVHFFGLTVVTQTPHHLKTGPFLSGIWMGSFWSSFQAKNKNLAYIFCETMLCSHSLWIQQKSFSFCLKPGLKKLLCILNQNFVWILNMLTIKIPTVFG